MNRELRLTRAFVDLADTLGAEYDALDLFTRLGEHCLGLLAVDAVGVVMSDARGELRTMSSSAVDLGRLDLLQLQQDDGPSVDCFRSGEAVTADDLRIGTRWPEYTAGALAAGYVSVHVLPLRLDGGAIGAVALANRRSGVLPDADLVVAQGMSDVTALTLTHGPGEHARPYDLLTLLQAALSAKAAVELAKGLLSEYADVSFAAALDLLAGHASRKRLPMTVVARALAERVLTPAEVLEGSPSEALRGPPGG
ncbi:GAF and ANTAR domain-containing protein [Streptomyces sp. S.PB5]|uniref:GAF and ANTAR domain-containing protein n=1 Tax=Streptomyces sp. S.PB5 TaxID=3020844 RepID=UPI0025AF832D|nr:GAF and ANTAR domain-containing protein [Streptomyces sp. S.PB5]MDN3023570.1 GAF and ANTAR domain-containing protein [Streptomyces sp. S.PB5]